MFPVAFFLMQNESASSKPCAPQVKTRLINTPTSFAKDGGHAWDQTRYTEATSWDFTQVWQ